MVEAAYSSEEVQNCLATDNGLKIEGILVTPAEAPEAVSHYPLYFIVVSHKLKVVHETRLSKH